MRAHSMRAHSQPLDTDAYGWMDDFRMLGRDCRGRCIVCVASPCVCWGEVPSRSPLQATQLEKPSAVPAGMGITAKSLAEQDAPPPHHTPPHHPRAQLPLSATAQARESGVQWGEWRGVEDSSVCAYDLHWKTLISTSRTAQDLCLLQQRSLFLQQGTLASKQSLAYSAKELCASSESAPQRSPVCPQYTPAYSAEEPCVSARSALQKSLLYPQHTPTYSTKDPRASAKSAQTQQHDAGAQTRTRTHNRQQEQHTHVQRELVRKHPHASHRHTHAHLYTPASNWREMHASWGNAPQPVPPPAPPKSDGWILRLVDTLEEVELASNFQLASTPREQAARVRETRPKHDWSQVYQNGPFYSSISTQRAEQS